MEQFAKYASFPAPKDNLYQSLHPIIPAPDLDDVAHPADTAEYPLALYIIPRIPVLATRHHTTGQCITRIPNISHGVLTAQLKELERYHIVDGRVLGNKPPKVEYSLSSLGKEFVPVMKNMIDFGKLYAKEVPVQFEDTSS